MFNVFGDEEEVGKELPLVAPQNPEQIDECNKVSFELLQHREPYQTCLTGVPFLRIVLFIQTIDAFH